MIIHTELLSAFLLGFCAVAHCRRGPVVLKKTTTAPVTEPLSQELALPCNCRRIYDPTCSGDLTVNEPGCVKDSLVEYSYVSGPRPWSENTTLCWTSFTCPAGTHPVYDWFEYTISGAPDSQVFSMCFQEGPNAGNWYHSEPPLWLPIPLKYIKCSGNNDEEN